MKPPRQLSPNALLESGKSFFPLGAYEKSLDRALRKQSFAMGASYHDGFAREAIEIFTHYCAASGGFPTMGTDDACDAYRR